LLGDIKIPAYLTPKKKKKKSSDVIRQEIERFPELVWKDSRRCQRK
jgi:hypothetical protein